MAGALLLITTLALTSCGSAGQATQSAFQPTPTPTNPLAWKFATVTAASWTPTPPPDAALHAPIPGAKPQWKAVALPPNFGFAYHVSWLGVSMGNGNVAYSCSQTSGAVETVKTTNAGQTWSRVADINQPWDGCMNVTVDSLNPRIALLNESAYTLDGGWTWHVGATSSTWYARTLATVGSRTYALRTSGQNDALSVSLDGLASWQDITGPMRGQSIVGFWANPITGALLAETMTVTFPAVPTLWLSSDDGVHWSHVAVPYSGADTIVVQTPKNSPLWTFCMNLGGAPGAIACSADSGAHWRDLPPLADTGLRGYGIVAIADDGAALALGTSDTEWRLYRLAPGAPRWQSLGATPPTTGVLLYTHVPSGSGVFWSLPSVKGGGSGDANPSDVYTANYPY